MNAPVQDLIDETALRVDLAAAFRADRAVWLA